MNKNRFIELVSLQEPISPSDMKDLEELIKNFPYCQAAHILVAKGSHDSGGMLSDQLLRKAAAYTVDRKNLKIIVTGRNSPQGIKETIQPPPDLPPNDVILPKDETKNTENISIPDPTAEHIENAPENNSDISNSTAEFIQAEEKKTDSEKSLLNFAELHENLNKLREAKRKASGDLQQTIIEKPKSSEPLHEKVLLQDLREKENEKIDQNIFEVKDLRSDKVFLISGIEDEPFIPQVLYASRLEEVYTEKDQNGKELPHPDHELLIEYLNFLESKRSRLNKKLVSEIIEKFIKEDPSIPYLDTNKVPETPQDLTEKLKTDSTPVSENFANLLEKQGKFEKAIDIFQKLLLKNPEKKAYFADRIQQLEVKLSSSK